MKIGIGADHRGFSAKSQIVKYLCKKGHSVKDYGTDSETPTDYPEIAITVAEAVARKKIKYGLLLCYSGQGMVMAANKVRGIRAALCADAKSARFARAHNNANVLVMPAGFLKSRKKIQQIIDTFLETVFEGGRHLRRIRKISFYENSSHRV